MVRTKGRGSGRRGGASSQSSLHGETTRQVGQPAQAPRTLHPLLTQQSEHRLKALADGVKMDRLVVRHGYHMPSWNTRYEPYVRQAGFLGIQQIMGGLKWDDGLICALVERWRPETHTFHLPVGEMTITLEDVSILLGLPIHGKPVCGATNFQWEEVVNEHLGMVPVGKAMANKSALSLSWLKENFSDLDEDATEKQVQQHARAYLLSLLGSVLLVDLTGDSVPCMYLPLLADLNQARSYSWGAAVLGRLYRQLCHGSGRYARQLGGCQILLQMWAWERLPSFRPKVLSRTVLDGLTPETRPPQGYYWSGKHHWIENKRGLDRYRDLIDLLQDEDIEWLPYTPEIVAELPPACMLHSVYWLSTAALIDFAIVETYHPDRVMRQFRKYQTIPPPDRSTLPVMHAVDRQKYPKRDWKEFHKEYVADWIDQDRTILREDRSYDLECLVAYLQWYNAATIPTFSGYLGLSTDGAPARERLERPELAIRKMVERVIKFAKKAARHMKRAMEPRFATQTFNLCRDVVGTVDIIATFDRQLANVGDDTTDEEEEGEQEVEGTEGAAGSEGLEEIEEGDVQENEEEIDPDRITLAKIRSQKSQLTQDSQSSPKRQRRIYTRRK